MLFLNLKMYLTFYNLFFITFSSLIFNIQSIDQCVRNDDKPYCSQSYRYLFYNVNPPEGFNLRRDVYLRVAQLVHELSKIGRWKLVLPPWPHLRHWRSSKNQARLPWSLFFDIPSLNKFVPVLEHYDLLDEFDRIIIDQVFVLQHDKEMFKSGKFVDRIQLASCYEPLEYFRNQLGRFEGDFWGFDDVFALKVNCLTFHGPAVSLSAFLNQSHGNFIMLDHAEVALHHNFGDPLYWKARRSMQFASHLIDYAADFRRKHLNSSDKEDGVKRLISWTEGKKLSQAPEGGPYLGVHLRRRDFVKVRRNTIPTIVHAANQMITLLKDLQLKLAFIATDATDHEKKQLEKELLAKGFRVLFYDNKYLMDGEIAIVEQIICSHAKLFIGSHESTFSFRIQEEREILGFSAERTFQRFCGDEELNCVQPARWLIKY